MPATLKFARTAAGRTLAHLLEEAMAQKFKIGDQVKLKAPGSQPMVTGEYSGDGVTVGCYWHNKQGKPEAHGYHEDMLEHYDPEDDVPPPGFMA